MFFCFYVIYTHHLFKNISTYIYTFIAILFFFLTANTYENWYSYQATPSHLLPFRQIFSSIAKHAHILTVAFSTPVLFSIMFIPHIEKRPLNSSLCNETRCENTTCTKRLNDKREQKIGWDSHLLGMIKL